ncbi:MAG: TPM domain-containing protein, partial [Acidimicrobiia bacterium]
MARRLALTTVLTLFLLTPLQAQAQPTCPPYQGIVCDGYVTDTVGVIVADTRLEEAVAAVVERHGHEIAVVVVGSTGTSSAQQFARELGNTWGVGDPSRNDGVVVLIDTGGRVTWIEHGPGLNSLRVDWGDLASAGDSSFRGGDFDGGVLAIVSSLDGAFAVGASGEPRSERNPRTGLWLLVLVGGLALGGYYLARSVLAERRRNQRRERRRRREAVDAQLARLRPGGHELPILNEFDIPPPESISDGLVTGTAASVLDRLVEDENVTDRAVLESLWHYDLVDVVDRARLLAETEVPLELRASAERDLLDDAVQAAAREALDVPLSEDARFEIRIAELQRLVDSLRPHRVAEARRTVAQTLADRLKDTPVGFTVLTDKGERFVKVAPVLDSDTKVAASLQLMDATYE